MRKLVSLAIVGVVAAMGGIVTLLGAVRRVTQGGLDADANGTSGAIPAGDYLQLAVGSLLVLCGIALVVYALVRGRRSQLQGL